MYISKPWARLQKIIHSINIHFKLHNWATTILNYTEEAIKFPKSKQLEKHDPTPYKKTHHNSYLPLLSKTVRKQSNMLTQIAAIMKTYLYNFDPLKPHFYIVKLGFTRVYSVFHISAQKHRCVLIRTASLRGF